MRPLSCNVAVTFAGPPKVTAMLQLNGRNFPGDPTEKLKPTSGDQLRNQHTPSRLVLASNRRRDDQQQYTACSRPKGSQPVQLTAPRAWQSVSAAWAELRHLTGLSPADHQAHPRRRSSLGSAALTNIGYPHRWVNGRSHKLKTCLVGAGQRPMTSQLSN